MTITDIIKHRLHNQQLAQHSFKDPAKTVAWMGAIQAQDYGAAKWALGQRVAGVVDDDIEAAFAKGTILRTHVMRPTWHFVAPADIRWLQQLTAHRVIALSKGQYRTNELDDKVFATSNKTLAKALDGKQLTRPELVAALEKAKIKTDELRFTLLLMRAELDGIICSGGRAGKQFTYALLDDRAPNAKVLEHDEALAELTTRYFTSHGPATLQDFAWWSGLTMATVKEGMELVKKNFISEVIDGQTYWFVHNMPAIKITKNKAYLLPNYDEYVVGYKERSMLITDAHSKKLDSRGNVLFNNIIVLDGHVAGTWKRTVKSKEVVVETTTFSPLNAAQKKAIAEAIADYKSFVDTE